RWKICKALKIPVTDAFFRDVNLLQLLWYAEQIHLDEKEDFESKRDFIEYMASFWNPEAVRKIKEARLSKESHAFADDEEFERQILKREVKNKPEEQAIKKIKQSENANNKKLNDDSKINTGR